MIGSTRQVRVFACAQPCDVRKHYDSLAVIVTGQMGHELLSGDLLLFVGRNRKRAKVLYLDGTGQTEVLVIHDRGLRRGGSDRNPARVLGGGSQVYRRNRGSRAGIGRLCARRHPPPLRAIFLTWVR